MQNAYQLNRYSQTPCQIVNTLKSSEKTTMNRGEPGLSCGSISKEYAYNVNMPGFDPWVGKIPWRRKWQPTPVFMSGESPWKEEPGGLQSIGSKIVGHD